ncbi:hypothetical protein L202_06706 [Cryptococcus amylolentus CBS 6039]|uniref:Uncharacterized protein n=1 Tax=Cryptococcus amylolentus CBS 6039 TaxID=1295533 RepID=A0A1E3HJI6_9TREE|nr:hypothetical protein L202_06706 [Cryptococcus amylolentus CBS 6039]ODN75581.1 hypothetical protein L202_06706 [Cryptococcus amylolentus CBS 6039]
MVSTKSKEQGTEKEEEGLLSRNSADTQLKTSDDDRPESQDIPESSGSKIQQVTGKYNALAQVPPLTSNPRPASTSLSPSQPCSPLTTYNQTTDQWVDAQAAYTDTWRSRYPVTYAILTVECIIPEIVSLAYHGCWMWGIFIVWICLTFMFGTLYYVTRVTKAAALKNVELVGEQMRLRFAANVEYHDLSILNFLDDNTIHPPPFSPIPPSILIFAHDWYSKDFAIFWVAYFFFCPYLMCLILGSVEILDDLDESGAAPWAIFGVHGILITLLWTYAAYDPYSHLRGKVDGQGAKRRWAWHKKHFYSWGTKAVQDVLKPEDISKLRKTADLPLIDNTPARSTIPRVVTVPAPANASTLSMDALLQELQRRANGDNLLEELQQRMNAGDAARAAYVALLGPRRNVDPPSYV